MYSKHMQTISGCSRERVDIEVDEAVPVIMTIEEIRVKQRKRRQERKGHGREDVDDNEEEHDNREIMTLQMLPYHMASVWRSRWWSERRAQWCVSGVSRWRST